MPIPGSRNVQVLVAVILLLAAGVVLYFTNREPIDTEALADVRYRVRCRDCGHTFELAAVNYLDDLGPEGVRCPSCGKYKAWRTGTADSVDPAEFKEEMQALTSVDQVSEASRNNQGEMDKINQQIADAEAAGDAPKTEELKKELARLQARMTAIYARWEALSRGS